MEDYEEIFEMLRARTGMKDVDQIIDLFSKYEEDNLSLFKLANDQTDEVQI